MGDLANIDEVEIKSKEHLDLIIENNVLRQLVEEKDRDYQEERIIVKYLEEKIERMVEEKYE